MSETRLLSPSNPIPVNPALVWDYDIPSDENQTSSFQKWYLARVLTRGSGKDLQTVGLHTIHAYLPDLNLPPEIRRFWEWYFDLPEVKPNYEAADTVSTTDR